MGLDLIRKEVPELRSRWKTFLIAAFFILVISAWIVFFWWIDKLLSYGPLMSQFLVAFIASNLEYMAIMEAPLFRERFGEQALRVYLFSRVIPLYVCWIALMLHPLLVEGDRLLPRWVSVPSGTMLMIYGFLLLRAVARCEESLARLLIFYMFLEEETAVNPGIYFYIRHPMYAGALSISLGFALIKSNAKAISTALIVLLPALVGAKLEDHELTRRSREYRRYVERTGSLFPHLRDLPDFLKFISSA
ncbi:MAG TPA: hypothetical protein ENG61_01655 [Candidatus Korarchaeota archaeon]|nr:hypothetical protein [Candidatus Korarchaeota archaeon]